LPIAELAPAVQSSPPRSSARWRSPAPGAHAAETAGTADAVAMGRDFAFAIVPAA
jgi:hypothetical protein